jgi:hypothetical protein
MWDWTILSPESIDEIVNKAGSEHWNSLNNEEKGVWIEENLTEEESDRYERESRLALLNQNGGKYKRRKRTRRRRQTRKKRTRRKRR